MMFRGKSPPKKDKMKGSCRLIVSENVSLLSFPLVFTFTFCVTNLTSHDGMFPKVVGFIWHVLSEKKKKPTEGETP